MPLALLLPLLLAQADATGPLVSPGAGPGLNLPLIDRASAPNRRRAEIPAAPPTPEGNRLSACLAQADVDPDAALDRAEDWLKASAGAARAAPQMCLGSAYAALGDWEESQAAFVAGRDSADPADHATRARLGTMAGNAMLAGGAPVGALSVLERARSDATATGDKAALGGIAVDSARALVLLNRNADAASALAEARADQPDDAATWLLSATLSRRMAALADAQAQIETAARLAPTDAHVGLEAGVIAQLAGHTAAARRSWQSVVAADPDGDAGHQAANYLAQTADPAAVGPATPHPGAPQ